MSSFFGDPKAVVTKAVTKPLRGSKGGGNTPLGPPRPKTTQEKRRSILDRTIADVHAGKYDEATGATVLRKAGFPDSKNPFAQPDSGGIVGAIANLPHGLKTAATPRRKGVLAQQDSARSQAGGVNAGIVAPGTGLLAQFLGPLAQATVNAPGGGVGFVEHPIDTGQRIVSHLSHPNLVEDAFYAYLAAHGLAAGGLRVAAAGRTLKAGEGVKAATTRSAHEGGSLLHTPMAKPVPITIRGQRPQPVDPPLGHGYRATTVKNADEQAAVDAVLKDPKSYTYTHARPELTHAANVKIGEIRRGAIKVERVPLPPGTKMGKVAEGPRLPGVTLERPVIQNPLVRPFSRRRSRQIEAALNDEGVARAYGIPLGRGKKIAAKTFVVRVGEAGTDAVDAISRPGYLYRGMTQDEFNATVGLGKGVASRKDWSLPGEGTSYGGDFGTAESYANFGSTDPRVTGKPNYIVEVPKGDIQANRQGYFQTDVPQTPARIWKVTPHGDSLVATEVGSGGRLPARRLGARTDAKIRGTFSAANTAGRELRAGGRIRLATDNAHADALHRMTRGLKPAERDAITVVAISGDEAFTNPAAAIARQVAAHEHWIGVGGDEARNGEHIASIRATQKVLENPSEKFRAAVQLAKDVSDATTAKLVSAGLLDPAAAAGRQAKIADMYGYSASPSGSFYFPLSERYQNIGITPAGGFETKPSDFGTGPPAMGTRVPGLNKGFTGSSLASGRLPNVGEATAKRATQVTNALQVRRQYDELWRIGRETKKSEFDIPVRDTANIEDDLRKFMADLSRSEHMPLDPDAAMALETENLGKLSAILDQGSLDKYGRLPPGSKIDGVRWVDGRLVAPSAPSVKGKLYKGADAITNPIRLTQLYARPAYILNLAGNLGMNGIAEGVRIFPALKQAVTAQRRLDGDVMREIDGGTGVSLSRTYSVGRGPLAEVNDRLAEFWNRITDMHSRRAAFFAEAARSGFKTDAQITDLVKNPALEAERSRVFRVANKNIVDYSSLTPFERDEVRRLIYFYPWVSRGTIWSLRALVEHPYKAFTMFELGQIGAENAHKELGQHLPAWVAQLGLVPVGHSKKGLPKVVNLSSLWTPTTAVQAFSAAADTAKAAAGLPHTMGGLGELATPALTELTQASSRYEGGPAGTGVIGLAQSIPYVQAARRAGLWGKPSKTYPETGLGVALGPLAVGGTFPRAISPGALATQAVNDQKTPRAKLAVQIDQAVEVGGMTREQADALLAQLPNASDEAVSSARRKLGPALKEAYAKMESGG